MLLAAVLTGLFLAALLLTGAIRRIALQWGALDVPVARSLHDAPVPVGGGLAIALLFLLYALACWRHGLLADADLIALAGGGAIVAGVGLFDDLRKLPLSLRLFLQFAAAAWVLFWLATPQPVDFLFFVIANSLLLNALAVLSLVWLINLYNFMDGIDGLAATELVFISISGFLLGVMFDDMALGLLSGGLCAAGLGFLAWNWPPARIFLGDVGSGFIGFSLGVLALLSLGEGGATVWTWLLLLGVFATDAMVTLLRRIWRGDKWHEGHCCHAYQHAARRFGSHGRVTVAILAINVCWLGPLACLSVFQPQWGMPLTLLGLAPLVWLAWKLGAGIPSAGR